MKKNLPINILLVDDEPANLLVLKTILGDLEANLIVAQSGEEALKHVLRTDFAAILMDVLMPTMSGFDTARMIRSRPQSRRTPILFITAAPDAPGFSLESAYALGGVDYLAKPINPLVLRAKVGFFIDLYRKNAELAQIEEERHAAALNAKDQRIRLILDNVQDYAFIVTDVEGRIVEWEGGTAAITGWHFDDVAGQHIEIIFTPEDRAAGRATLELARAKASGRAEDKRWHLRQDGSRFFADGLLVSLTDDEGELHGFAKIFRDGTAKWRAEEALRLREKELRESREWFSLLLESSGEGLCGLGPEATCTFINPAGAAMLGYRPDELIGRPIHDLIHHHRLDASHYPLEECKIRKASQGGTSIRVDDEVFWHRDGTPIPVSYSVSPMIENGEVKGSVITYTDITSRKNVEEDLRKLAADLSEADRVKTEFLATLAHELRNPLAPIRNGLEIMRLGAPEPEALGRVRDMMERQLSHLVRLVDDLLDVARITNGKLELKKERIDVKSIVATAVEASLPLIQSEKHALTVYLPEQDFIIYADGIRIAQVLSNLLNNAAKYTPPGGHITLSAKQENMEAVVSITDTGIGIPKELLPRVFDMFTQIGSNAGRSQGGLGIGLSLVQRLVEMHDGSITAGSSGSGKGSTFTLRLPLFDKAGPANLASTDCQQERDQGIGRQLQVLVVDDNVDAALTLCDLLEISGYSALVAHNGYEALKVTREAQPDVIFLDIGMPGMNGYEVAKAVRLLPEMKHVVLVALTGWGADNDRKRSAEAGFDKHFTKPVTTQMIVQFLASLQSVPPLSIDISAISDPDVTA